MEAHGSIKPSSLLGGGSLSFLAELHAPCEAKLNKVQANKVIHRKIMCNW